MQKITSLVTTWLNDVLDHNLHYHFNPHQILVLQRYNHNTQSFMVVFICCWSLFAYSKQQTTKEIKSYHTYHHVQNRKIVNVKLQLLMLKINEKIERKKKSKELLNDNFLCHQNNSQNCHRCCQKMVEGCVEQSLKITEQ